MWLLLQLLWWLLVVVSGRWGGMVVVDRMTHYYSGLGFVVILELYIVEVVGGVVAHRNQRKLA